MRKSLIVAALFLSLITNAFAETYPKIIYSGGHPDLQAEKLRGNLVVLSDRVEFTAEGSEGGIKIPYETVQKVSLVHVVGGRPYLKTTAWVTGIVLAPLTFGASLLPAVGVTGLKKNGYYVSVEYKDDVDLAHAVNFMVKGSNLQLKVKGDIENQVYRYRKALKEGKTPVAAVQESVNEQTVSVKNEAADTAAKQAETTSITPATGEATQK